MTQPVDFVPEHWMLKWSEQAQNISKSVPNSLKQPQNNQEEECDDKDMKEVVSDTRDYQNQIWSTNQNRTETILFFN